MKLVEVMRPDWYETLNDADTVQESSKKRIEKSLKNSAKFLRECIEIHQSSEVTCKRSRIYIIKSDGRKAKNKF